MQSKKGIDILATCAIFAAPLVFSVLSLYQGLGTITDEIEKDIHILTNILCINAIVSGTGSYWTLDIFHTLLTGKTSSILGDLKEKNSQDIAVEYNGMIGGSLYITAVVVPVVLYSFTKNQLFITVSVILAVAYAVGTIIHLLATYLKGQNKRFGSVTSKLSGAIYFPMIICLIQLLVARTPLVGFVYHNIYRPQSDIHLILSLIIVLLSFLAIVYCHFTNIYCLIGSAYVKRDIAEIQRKIDSLQQNEKAREKIIRKKTKYIDKRAEQAGFFRKLGLVFIFYSIHIKTYTQNRLDSVKYVLTLVNIKISKRLCDLLNPEKIRINGIRFCWVTMVFELLVLDLLLFIYLESTSPCLKFFELLSTVIIIPVLLSWLAELKPKRD